MKPTRPLVAVDSDTLLFRAAAVCDNRTIQVTHKPTGITKSFQNKTEFKDLMKAKSKEITDDYLITEVQNPSPVDHALAIVKSGVEEILDNFSDCDVIFCAGATGNFRDNLPYPTRYKGNRSSMLRPVLLSDCHQYLQKSYNAVKALGNEVDDEVAILAYEALEQGREAFILSPDGDSRQFDGIKLGDYKSLPSTCELLEFFPAVSWNADKKLVCSSGFPWMIMQLCVGDTSDGLNPCNLCGKRYGEKSWYNAVKDFTTPEQYAQYAIDLYHSWYPDTFEYVTWDAKVVESTPIQLLELYWKGTTMKRKRNELPDFWSFLKERGIKL
jgi:hypothetical protein